MTQAFESYNQLSVLKRPLTGLYLSFFLMVTLLILVGATGWGSTSPKRITRPGADARGGGAGDRRRSPRSARRAAEQRRVRLARRGVQYHVRRAGEEPAQASSDHHRARAQAPRGRRSPPLHRDDSRAHHDRRRVGGRRRRDHDDQQRRGAAARPRSRRSSVSRRKTVFDRADLQPLGALLAGAARRRPSRPHRKSRFPRDGQELHLAVVATALSATAACPRAGAGARRRDAADSRAEGRGVARSGPPSRARDQESADADSAVRRTAAPAFRRAAARPTGARRRVHGDDRRRGRVAQGAGRRVLAVRADAGAAHGADRSRPAHHRYDCALQRHLRRRPDRAAVRAGRAARAARRGADPPRHHQPRRQRHRSHGAARPRSSSKRSSTARTASSRVIVADDGPGIPPAEREKLFLPYYSTKRRGSGLGLAIVRRIIAEHGGSIDVGDNTPRGTRFTIELPC